MIIPLVFFAGLHLAVLSNAEARPSRTQITATSCPRKIGGERPIALLEYVYALPKAQDAVFSYEIDVWSVEASGAKSDAPRIWQFETGNMYGANPATHWTGTVICGREADRAYFLLVRTHGIRVSVEIYSIDLSATQPYRLPRAETLENAVLTERDAPAPIISLLAQTDTCLPDPLIASWEGENLAIAMSHGAEDCKVFKLVFDPKKIEFPSVPKEWFSVETRLGKRPNF